MSEQKTNDIKKIIDAKHFTVKNGINFVRKPKESYVINYITEYFPQYKWIINKKINLDEHIQGEYKPEPDILLELDDIVIIIEIDENQHKYYNGSKENERTKQLVRRAHNKKIYIIRFNPDKYISNN